MRVRGRWAWMSDDDDFNEPLLTRADAAKAMFPTGQVKGETLLGYVHKGKLKAYRIGKSYWTTLSAVREMFEACRVEPKGGGSVAAKTESLDSSSIKAASIALDLAMAQPLTKKTKRKTLT
jgi:hypothetical protein